VLAID
jgi:hypothetical protein